MSKEIRQTESSETLKVVSVADYIVDRLAAEGINHCFGVAGDFRSATRSTAARR
jgi:indolepyruvate decarboxylase